jgi:RimJ/RimL family protein N-acetyltransferase
MTIIGNKIILRAIEESDLPKLHKWSNDSNLWDMLDGWHFPSSYSNIVEWFNNIRIDNLNQRFAIEVEKIGLVGTANLVDIDWKNNHAFHGMMLGDLSVRGMGIGYDTIMTIMKYAFDELHLERLNGSMIEYNEASLDVYCRKCNWKIEGRQRNWYYRKGRYWDKIIVGITKEDYLTLNR